MNYFLIENSRKFYFFLFFLIFLFLLFIFSSRKIDHENYSYIPQSIDFNNNKLEYQYLRNYFDICFHSNQKFYIEKVKNFFYNTTIIFITMKRIKNRIQNVKHIIDKYHLTNHLILPAIDFKNIKQDNTSYYKYDNNIKYSCEDSKNQSPELIACLLSHLKAIISAKQFKTPYVVFMEDDVSFDCIPFQNNTIETLFKKLPPSNHNKNYISLYTNKPLEETKDFYRKATIAESFYGAVSYVFHEDLIDDIYRFTKKSSNHFSLPKRKGISFIADHYFTSLYNNFHLPQSIIIPNNFLLSSTLHPEKNNSHIDLSTFNMKYFYDNHNTLINITSNLILLKKNPNISWYKKTYPDFKFFFVSSFQDGIKLLKSYGGYFIFSSIDKFKLPIPSSLLSLTAYFIISVKNHPSLDWMIHFETIFPNNLLYLKNFKLKKLDYSFYTYPVQEKFIILIHGINDKKWIQKNISSILRQKHVQKSIHYINHEDKQKISPSFLKKIKKQVPFQEFFFQKKKNWNKFYYSFLKKFDPSYIFVFMDGKDWLPNDYTLFRIQKEYNKGSLCTYGRYATLDENNFEKNKLQTEYPEDLFEIQNIIRFQEKINKFPLFLRTSRVHLLQSIPINYFKDINGDWIQDNIEDKEWFWTLQKSRGNISFIKDITYIRNDT